MKRPAKINTKRNTGNPGNQISRLSRRGFLTSLVTASLLLFTTCQGPFDLETALGLEMGGLTVSPNNVSIDPGATQLITVNGGTGPYSWEIYAGPGTLVSSADITSTTTGNSESYDPGGSEGITTIRVTDIEGFYGQTEITVITGGAGPVDPLQLLAGSTTIDVDEELTLFATGGVSPYIFDLMTDGTGSSSVSGNIYTAGSTSGSDVVRLRDSNTPPTELTVTITVNSVATVTPVINYGFNTVTLNPPTVLGESLSGDFIYENLGTSDGTDNIEWNAYWSTNTSFSGITNHITSGSLSALNGLSPSLAMTIGGNWPSESGNYYLILHLSTTVDTNVTNNTWVSGIQNMNVDYQVPTPPAGGSVKSGDPVDVTFLMENLGDVDGSGSVVWTAYISEDAALGSGDTEIQSGNFTALDNDGQTENITVNATTWPIVEITANRNIILEWYSTDDPDNIKTSVSSTFNINPIDVNYQSIAPIPGGPTYFTGSSINETFRLQNSGDDDGSVAGTWTTYLSSDATLSVLTDTIIDAGSFPALLGSGAATTDISVDAGTWPMTSGPAYLILEWTADDDLTAPKTAISSSFSIADRNIDYTGAWAAVPAINTAGSSYAVDFTITNSGGDDGTVAGTYTAYLSEDNVLGLGDSTVISGSFGPITNIGSEIISVIGTWPENDTDRYLIMEWSADDDSASPKTLVSGQFAVTYPDADYRVQTATLAVTSSEIYTGGSFDVEVVFENAGSQDALDSDLWDWEIYLSQNSTEIIGVGDILIASGTDETALTASPAAGSTFSVSIPSANWPVDEGDYYLKARVSAPHDSDTANDIDNSEFSGPYGISNASDFTVTNFIVPGTSGYLQDFTGIVVDIEDINRENNTEAVYCEIYASADSSLETAEDTLIFQESLATPPSGTDVENINFNLSTQMASHPYAGEMYLFATITSATDNNPGNNTVISTPIDILEGDSSNLDYSPNGYSQPILDDSTIDTFYSGAFVPDAEGTDTVVTEIHRIDLNEQIYITGATDGGNTQVDTYHFPTGPGVGKIQAQMVWSSAEDYDFYMWNWNGSESTKGGDTFVGSEPDDLAYVWALVVNENSDGYISVFDPVNTASPAGQSYVITLTGVAP